MAKKEKKPKERSVKKATICGKCSGPIERRSIYIELLPNDTGKHPEELYYPATVCSKCRSELHRDANYWFNIRPQYDEICTRLSQKEREADIEARETRKKNGTQRKQKVLVVV